MRSKLIAAGAAAMLVTGAAQAQDLRLDNLVLKLGVTRYTTNTKTGGVKGIGVPPGADADTGDATTVLFVAEYYFTPNIAGEIVIGLPPRIEARATGTVAFLGNNILSAKNASPAAIVNYHFGQSGDRWRPYVGVGINYTKFVSIRSRLADQVEMKDSVGPTAQAGINYSLNKQTGLWASVAALKTKTDLVAVGSTVLTSTIDFRPVVYSVGASYRF
jgi:outer membrane protein